MVGITTVYYFAILKQASSQPLGGAVDHTVWERA